MARKKQVKIECDIDYNDLLKKLRDAYLSYPFGHKERGKILDHIKRVEDKLK